MPQRWAFPLCRRSLRKRFKISKTKHTLWHASHTKTKCVEGQTQDPGEWSPSRGQGRTAAASPSCYWPTTPACSRLGASGASVEMPPWGFTSCLAGKPTESRPAGRGAAQARVQRSSVPGHTRQGSTGCCPRHAPGSSGPPVAATPPTSSNDSKLKWRFYPVL